MTEAEKSLWSLLRNRKFAGHKFRRQVPIGRYVADFACYEGRLVVEVDGSQHFESVRDARRDAELKARGFRVLRVWNTELNGNRDGVLEAIYWALVGPAEESPSSALRAPSPTRGEGDGADASQFESSAK